MTSKSNPTVSKSILSEGCFSKKDSDQSIVLKKKYQ